MPPFALEGLDHVVLPVDDLAAVRDFYCNVIGCTVEGGLPEYGMYELRAGAALIVLVDVAGEPGAWARPPVAGGRNMDHLCIATGPWDRTGCAPISPPTASRSRRRTSMAAPAATACPSTSAIRPAT